MKTVKISLVMMVFFVFVVPAAYCEYQALENPVHEQRKAEQKKRKKEVYGPKTALKSEEKKAGPATSEDLDKGKEKAEGKEKKPEEMKVKQGGKTSAAGKTMARPTSAKKEIPPPSKELQAMKKRRDAAKKAAAAKAVDIEGTVNPVAPNAPAKTSDRRQ